MGHVWALDHTMIALQTDCAYVFVMYFVDCIAVRSYLPEQTDSQNQCADHVPMCGARVHFAGPG